MERRGRKGDLLLTFPQSDHVVGLLARRARSHPVHGQDSEAVHCVRIQVRDLQCRRVCGRQDPVVVGPVPVLSHPAIWTVSF